MHRKLTDRRLVLASHNAGKLVEMRELMRPYGIEIVSAGELGLPEPDETGLTFKENAEIKALASATGANLPALSDDSGLCVDVLAGAPGIYSARWAGDSKDFTAAMQRIEDLLEKVGAIAPQLRTAHFVSALTLAWPDGHCETFEGRVFIRAQQQIRRLVGGNPERVISRVRCRDVAAQTLPIVVPATGFALQAGEDAGLVGPAREKVRVVRHSPERKPVATEIEIQFAMDARDLGLKFTTDRGQKESKEQTDSGDGHG